MTKKEIYVQVYIQQNSGLSDKYGWGIQRIPFKIYLQNETLFNGFWAI